MEYALKTTGITKKFGRQKVLSGVDINVPKGAVYGLIGKNGAGKTTLLRIITGLTSSASGEVKMNTPHQKVSAIIEAPGYYDEFTVMDNMKSQCRIRGIDIDEGKLSEILAMVNLTEAKNKKASKLSLGMKQRLGLAMALVGDTELVILDEPLNGLDPQGIIDIRNIILNLNKEKGITFIISSHLLGELSKVATVYSFLNNGVIVKEISQEEVKSSGKVTTSISVSDVKKLAIIFDEMNVEYTVETPTQITAYKELSIEELLPKMQAVDVQLHELSVNQESIESIYTNIMNDGAGK
ncbi:MAG: ATP-binding cassette domain-containing protein [Saccharofermentans sp.]|nr:ATP-binding cassette domain-containing protein [Saccharofermentans sp.]